MKFDVKKLALGMVLGLVLVTMLNYLLSTVSSMEILKTGPAFILLFISVFIVYLFVVVQDAKLMKGEIVTVFIVVLSLIFSGWALQHYLPEIFSILPEATKQVFSAIIG